MSGGLVGPKDSADADGNPNAFNVEHNDDGRWLNNNWAKPENQWNPDNKFLFRLRNSVLFRHLLVAVFLIWLFKILFPTAEHLASLVKLYGDLFVVVMGNKFCFPGD